MILNPDKWSRLWIRKISIMRTACTNVSWTTNYIFIPLTIQLAGEETEALNNKALGKVLMRIHAIDQKLLQTFSLTIALVNSLNEFFCDFLTH